MGSTELRKYGVGEGNEKMTDKMRRFSVEYPIDYNGKRAAIAAGYSPKCAAVMAAKLLKNPLVARAIGAAERKTLEGCVLSREQVELELACIVYRDPVDLCDPVTGYIVVDDLRKLPPRIRHNIDGLKVRQRFDQDGNVVGQEVELKLCAKVPAIDLAMKHLGMHNPERHEHEHHHTIDWASMYSRPPEDEVDVIEARLTSNQGNGAKP